MSSYKKILESTKEAKTISSHIKALGKIRAKTEDSVLLGKLDGAIGSLQGAHARATKGKSIPTCLDKATDRAIKELLEYCNRFVADEKPEWQVLAERNNWAPKA